MTGFCIFRQKGRSSTSSLGLEADGVACAIVVLLVVLCLYYYTCSVERPLLRLGKGRAVPSGCLASMHFCAKWYIIRNRLLGEERPLSTWKMLLKPLQSEISPSQRSWTNSDQLNAFWICLLNWDPDLVRLCCSHFLFIANQFSWHIFAIQVKKAVRKPFYDALS